MQQRLHKYFRKEILLWEHKELVKGAVLTYHFGMPKEAELLYLCLDVPTVQNPNKRELILPTEVINQIPSEILGRINEICNLNQVSLGHIFDYEYDIMTARERAIASGKDYYHNAPVNEILRFASVGTKIAIKILEKTENQKKTFINTMELADTILSSLKTELGGNYFWLPEAFHFTCNPLLRNDEGYLWMLAIS